MNIKLLSKIGIILGSILMSFFLLFLLLPVFINFAIDKYTPQIAGEINKMTGLSAGLEDVKIVTTPKLTAGLKVKKFELYTPKKEPIFIADDFQVKISLLPFLAKNIRIDTVQLKNADITLKFNKNGELDLLQYLPVQEQNENEDVQTAELPFNMKLSNHLPDIHIGGYKLTITNGKDNYILSGNKTDVTDFVFNKSIKLSTSGKFDLKDRNQFNFDIKLLNKIMPKTDLNEFVFNPQEEENKKEAQPFYVISALKGLYDYKVTANLSADLKTEPSNVNGKLDISNVSIIDLPKSNANLMFKGENIGIASNIYTAENEVSTLNGNITTGKKPYIDLNLKSDVETSNILNIVKKIALIFNIKDLQTLSANGRVNADFSIKSDTKTVQSSGFLKIPSAKLYYGLYKIGVDNINADVSLDNNNINIKNIGFSVLSQPLRLFGTIKEDGASDLHLTADRLSIKGLLIALGQASLMKENQVNSGVISMDAVIKGKLDKINPLIKLSIQNVNIKNIPLDITLKAPETNVNITSDGKTFGGNAVSANVWLINPMLKAHAPRINANIKEDVIEITDTPVTIEKIKSNIKGKITNYLTPKIGLDFITTGDIKSTLKGDMNVEKQTLNLTYQTTELSTIIIPMFDKSKLSFTGKIGITGSMMNPIVSGSASVPMVSIPEIPVKMSNMNLKFYDTILHGSGSVETFETGGIKAENLTGDFVLKGMDFYLNNLKGTSFKGKVSGNIIYNLATAKTVLDFKGSGMDAEKAIEGAAGIKKALSGTLGFDTKLKLTVLPDYNAMMKTLNGNLNFDIKKGAFGTIGKFEGLLNASNIINNVLLKNTVSAISNATGLATTAQFESLDGKMTIKNGVANLHPIKSAGPSLCYYVTGSYNLINATTNVVILGRLDAPMVAKLGPIGELSADKLLGYIPKFGATTAKILNIMTTNPKGENVKAIPALTNGSTNYKDFKVSFNGGIDSKSSIKSFKWLSNPDLSEFDNMSTKDVIKNIKTSFDTDVQTTVDNVTNSINAQKKAIENTRNDIKNSAEEIKNLFKSFKQQPVQTTETKVEQLPAENNSPVQETTPQAEVKQEASAE